MKSWLFIILFLNLSCNMLFAQTKNEKLGVCTHFDQGWSLSIMDEVAAVGCAWIRDGVNWSEVENTKGVYKLPQRTINWLAKAKKNKLKVLLVLAGGNKLYYDEYDKIAFSRFAKYVVLNYGNYVQAIEILNEPNNSGFSQYYEKGKATFNGLTVNGGAQGWVSKYLDLLNYTATEVKKVKPQIAVIGLGALPPTNIMQIKKGISSNVDGISDHPYHENATFVPFANNTTFLQRDKSVLGDQIGTYYSYIRGYQTLLNTYKKANKQIWVTEFGYSTSAKDIINNRDREYIQASLLSKRIIESFSLGVFRSFIYCFRDNCQDVSNKECGFGLRKTDGSTKVAFDVIKRLAYEMKGFTNRKNTEIVFGKLSTAVVSDFKNNDRYRIYSFVIKGVKTYYLWCANNEVLKTVYIKGMNWGSLKLVAKNVLTDKAIDLRIDKSTGSITFANNQSADNIIKLTIN